jgi:hypothetical protein
MMFRNSNGSSVRRGEHRSNEGGEHRAVSQVKASPGGALGTSKSATEIASPSPDH